MIHIAHRTIANNAADALRSAPQVPTTRIHIWSLNCALVASTPILNGILLLSRPDLSSRTLVPCL